MLNKQTASHDSASWGTLWRSMIVVSLSFASLAFFSVDKAYAAINVDHQIRYEKCSGLSAPDPDPMEGYLIVNVTDSIGNPVSGATVVVDQAPTLFVNKPLNSSLPETYQTKTEADGSASFLLFDRNGTTAPATPPNNLHSYRVTVTSGADTDIFTDNYESLLCNYEDRVGSDWIPWGSGTCNDGIINPAIGEQCEDGNSFDGDGCSSICTNEAMFCPSGQDLNDSYGMWGPYVDEFSVDDNEPNSGDTITFTVKLRNSSGYEIYEAGTTEVAILTGSTSGVSPYTDNPTYTVPDGDKHVYVLRAKNKVSPSTKRILTCESKSSVIINQGISCNITLNPPAVGRGDNSYLEWTSNQATSCSASWDGSITAASGDDNLTPVVTTPLSMSCTGPTGVGTCDATLVYENNRPINAFMNIDGVLVTPGSPPPVKMGKEPTLRSGLPAEVHRIKTSHGDLDSDNNISDNDLAFAYLYLNGTGVSEADSNPGYLLAAYDFDQDQFFLADLSCVDSISCWSVAPFSGLTVPGVNGYVTMYGFGYNGNAGVDHLTSGDPAATYISDLQVKTGDTYANKNLSELVWYVRLQNWNENVTANLAIMDKSGATQF